jgi:hypothetical protein
MRIRVTPRLRAEFEAAAELRGLNRSEAARLAMEIFIDAVADQDGEGPPGMAGASSAPLGARRGRA